MGSDGKPACLPFFSHEMLADRIARGETDYATLIEPSASLDDLDPEEFDRFRERARLGSNSGSIFGTLGDVEILSALGVAEVRGDILSLKRGARLLFGRTEPDYSRTTAEHVSVSLELEGRDLDLVRFVINHDQNANYRFELPDLQFMRALKDSPRMTLSEIAEVLQQAKQRTQSRLTKLLEEGLVEMRGDGRARRYILSASTYRSLEGANDYVRVRAFDAPQQAHMILNYVDAHGSISRGEAAELCGTSPESVRNLLFKLRDEGVLRTEGKKRGTRYFRANI